MDELNDCMRISYEGFEKQFRALLVAIEAGQPSLARSVSEKEREFKRLSFSINYDGKGDSVARSKGKEKVVFS